MARKKKHEEHVNAEAWAIPYGDLVTLLFALFTVMYAMSSVNEGKFRVLSDSMIAAFNGAPKSMQPINVGEKQVGKGGDKQLMGVTPTVFVKNKAQKNSLAAVFESAADGPGDGALNQMQDRIQDAMKALIDANQVNVTRENNWLEITINTDILFPSGAADFSTAAEPVLDKLADVLRPFPNDIRVEGHTDDRPIHTDAFPSNWELSAARAASVVHQFTKVGIDPMRLEIVGFGEFRPKQSNDTVEGRNANRRVAVLVLEDVGTGNDPDAPGATTAHSSGAADTVVSGPGAAAASPGDVGKTVLVKDSQRAIQPPAAHIGPTEMARPGSEAAEAKPAAEVKHE
jgi:chemotaxis protein MotB